MQFSNVKLDVLEIIATVYNHFQIHKLPFTFRY